MFWAKIDTIPLHASFSGECVAWDLN